MHVTELSASIAEQLAILRKSSCHVYCVSVHSGGALVLVVPYGCEWQETLNPFAGSFFDGSGQFPAVDWEQGLAPFLMVLADDGQTLAPRAAPSLTVVRN